MGHITAGINGKCSLSGAWFDHSIYGSSPLSFLSAASSTRTSSFAIKPHSKRSGALSSMLQFKKAISSPVFSISARQIPSTTARSHNSLQSNIFLFPLPNSRSCDTAAAVSVSVAKHTMCVSLRRTSQTPYVGVSPRNKTQNGRTADLTRYDTPSRASSLRRQPKNSNPQAITCHLTKQNQKRQTSCHHPTN